MKKISFLIILLSFLHSYADAQIALTGNITTIGVTSYPTHIDSLGKGGYMIMPTTLARDNIPTLRRKKGMLVYVQDIDVLYRLGSATLDNSNWVVVSLLSATSNIQTFLASPTSANLSAAITDEAGSNSLVFSNNPTLSNATLSGTLTLTAPLTAVNGGTGQSTYAIGDILYASSTSALSRLTKGTEGQVLLTSGTGIPTWGSNGLYTLNGQSAITHTFATANTASADFTITTALGTGTLSNTAIHTFNLPNAGLSTRGLVSVVDQSFKGVKTFESDLISNGTYIGRGNSQGTGSPGLASNISIGVGTKNFSTSTGGNSTQGINNIAIGRSVLSGLTTGYNNNAVGYEALKNNTTGHSNNAFGFTALSTNTTGYQNTAFGDQALQLNNGTIGDAGSNNTAVGWTSLVSNQGGYQNTAIGSASGVVTGGLYNATAIGYFAKVGANNTIQLGNTEVTSVVTSGTLSATGATVANLKLTRGTPTVVGAVLTATATDGTMGWSANSSAASLSGGVAGAIPFQTAPSVTGFTAAGTSGQIFVSAGTSTPTWTSNITVGTATATSLVTNTLRVTGGSFTTTGAVLTSDGNGNATWNSSGLYTLNGITAAGQTFSTTTTSASTIPSFTSTGTVHTLNIPSASVTGTTAGLLSNTDYNTFSSAVNSATSTNTANTIVRRDGSGGFNTGTITSTSLVTNTLRVTGGSPTAGSILTANNADGTVGFTAQGTSGQILVSAGTSTPTWTSNITVGTVTATSASVTTLNATSLVLTGNLTATSANFSRAVTGAPAAAFTSTSTTTIDFSSSNLAYSGQSSKDFTLSNLRDGGTYTLAWQNTFTGLTATFTSAGFSFVSLGNYAVVTNKNAVYTFVVMGSTVYYSMVSAQ